MVAFTAYFGSMKYVENKFSSHILFGFLPEPFVFSTYFRNRVSITPALEGGGLAPLPFRIKMGTRFDSMRHNKHCSTCHQLHRSLLAIRFVNLGFSVPYLMKVS